MWNCAQALGMVIYCSLGPLGEGVSIPNDLLVIHKAKLTKWNLVMTQRNFSSALFKILHYFSLINMYFQGYLHYKTISCHKVALDE